MKLEALTGGIIQSAFNNFAKFTVEHLCWSLFLIKLQVWWCATFWRKKNSGTRVFLAWTDTWVKWTKTIVFTKSIYWETPVMASFLVQLQTRGLTVFQKETPSHTLFHENWHVLQNINLQTNAARLLLISCDIFNALLALLVIDQLSHSMEI